MSITQWVFTVRSGDIKHNWQMVFQTNWISPLVIYLISLRCKALHVHTRNHYIYLHLKENCLQPSETYTKGLTWAFIAHLVIHEQFVFNQVSYFYILFTFTLLNIFCPFSFSDQTKPKFVEDHLINTLY